MGIGPILVQMKVKPPVAAATTGVTLLVLASSTSVVYACRGTAPWRYALLLSSCTFFGSLVGKSLIGWYVKQTRKQSVIVWILAGITMLSTLLLATVGMRTALADGLQTFRFRNFCPGVRSDVSPQQEIQDIPHDT